MGVIPYFFQPFYFNKQQSFQLITKANWKFIQLVASLAMILNCLLLTL